jgi:hypothetical protein
MSDQRSDHLPNPSIVGEVQAFDPRPSVEAAAAVLHDQSTEFALIGGLALDAWGIPRATKDVDFAVPVGAAEKAAEALRGPETEIRPLRIGGVGVRDAVRGLRIDLIDRRFHFAALFTAAIEDAVRSGRKARVGRRDVALASLEFLLAMKLVSGDPKDDADVRRILQRQELRYHDARALVQQHLGVASANRLDALARDAGRPEMGSSRLYRNGEEPE